MEMEEIIREIIEEVKSWDVEKLIAFILAMVNEKDFALLGEKCDEVIEACAELLNAVREVGASSPEDIERIKRARQICDSMGVSLESQEAIIECAKMTIGKSVEKRGV